jgi:membrane protein XagC
MNRALAAAPIALLAFVIILVLASAAVRAGFVADDALRLWAGASTAVDGGVSIGRTVAGYPTIPFLTTTLIAALTPAGTPAPALVAAGLLGLITGFVFLAFRDIGLSRLAAGTATLLVAFHPALLDAAIGGPADMFLAIFLFMFCRALFDLRARSGTSEVMATGLALLALVFSHPMGAAIGFAAVPFLAFAVRPALVASSAFNVVIALIFPTVFAVGAFSYVAWIFPGAGWSFFAAPAASLAVWTADVAHVFGNKLSGFRALDASLAMGAALAIGAPMAWIALAWVYRRRPLLTPALVFAATMIAATAITVLSGLFGDPTAIAVAAPVLAAVVVTRVPVVRERRLAFVVPLLTLGWLGGLMGVALVDPGTLTNLRATLDGRGGDHERLDALGAGGAATGRNGMLADTDNAPAFVLGRGGARGIFGPSSEPFALALLFSRIEAPFVAVPDPQSNGGMNDRLNRAFPTLFREGKPGYDVVYQNNTWRVFGRINMVEPNEP